MISYEISTVQIASWVWVNMCVFIRTSVCALCRRIQIGFGASTCSNSGSGCGLKFSGFQNSMQIVGNIRKISFYFWIRLRKVEFMFRSLFLENLFWINYWKIRFIWFEINKWKKNQSIWLMEKFSKHYLSLTKIMQKCFH